MCILNVLSRLYLGDVELTGDDGAFSYHCSSVKVYIVAVATLLHLHVTAKLFVVYTHSKSANVLQMSYLFICLTIKTCFKSYFFSFVI